ncbi:MAG: hypothetical protein AAGI03_10590 [Pseudomonadota bacterium]
MKRAHRKWHLALWLLIAPVVFVVLALAVLDRPVEPSNTALPDPLIREAG